MKINILKFEKVIFYLILLFLPTQIGKHFWPDFSMVLGIRVDYLSPTLYFTDVLILILFILTLAKSKFSIFNFQFLMKSKFKNFNIKNSFQISNFKFQISLFMIFLITGILMSKSPVLGLYGLLKIIEFGFFGFYTANYLRGKTQSIYGLITICFVIGIFFESLLGIAHYLNQGSIGGILYFFGEREFSQSTPGIANASINGELMLRPYGTFPHPNVLAGYLVIAMAITISNIKYQISNIKKTFYFSAFIIGTIALFLTMSRVAILIWILFLFAKIYSAFKYKFLSLLTLFGFLSIILLSPLSQRFINVSPMDQSVQLRKELVQISFTMIKRNPLFGVGLNNFLVNTASYLQPVHDIYLLIAAQIGIVGLLMFLWFIGKTFKKIKNQKSKIKNFKFITLSIILILGLFDHYFLTIQQGQLLFSFILGLCWRGKK